ncbi:S-layer homology domain-containing protein [Bhargavaea ginsengi]|uniref:S-layer homology domain-containing protein n=1 Tax=Bhargavaea ginsengi TaxID=426757 RepID=UPI003C752F8A
MKGFAKWCAAAVLAASAFVPGTAAAKGYSDVSPESEHSTNIFIAQEAGVMTGYPDGTFKPNMKLTRGQTIKALGKLELNRSGETLESYDYSGIRPFDDVPADHPDNELYKYSLIVRNAGIFDGDPNNHINPAPHISREQMAKVLVGAFGLKDIPNRIASIRDIGQAATYFQDHILILSENRVTKVDTFRPKEHVSRAQFASFLVRAHDERVVNYAIESVDFPDTITLAVGEHPEPPTHLNVTLVNGVVTETPVFWDLRDLDTMTEGEYDVTGTVGDTGHTLEVKVIVEDPMGVSE